MVWYDMTWHDMRYDMIWYMMWCDVMWCDMIWYDMIWYDMIWYGLPHSQRCDSRFLWNNTLPCYDTAGGRLWYFQHNVLEMPWFAAEPAIWFEMWYDMMVWYDVIWYSIWMIYGLPQSKRHDMWYVTWYCVVSYVWCHIVRYMIRHIWYSIWCHVVGFMIRYIIYGMIWCGMTRYGMIYDVVWCDAIRYGMIWYGTVRWRTLWFALE